MSHCAVHRMVNISANASPNTSPNSDGAAIPERPALDDDVIGGEAELVAHYGRTNGPNDYPRSNFGSRDFGSPAFGLLSPDKGGTMRSILSRTSSLRSNTSKVGG